MNKATIKQKIIDITCSEIASDLKNEVIYNKLLPIIEKHNGKPHSKKFIADVKGLFPDAQNIFTHCPCRSFTNLTIQFQVEEITFLVSYSGHVDLSDYKRCNTFAQESEHERIKKNTAFINNEKLIDQFVEHYFNIMKAREFFKENGSYEIPAFYSIARALDIKVSDYER